MISSFLILRVVHTVFVEKICSPGDILFIILGNRVLLPCSTTLPDAPKLNTAMKKQVFIVRYNALLVCVIIQSVLDYIIFIALHFQNYTFLCVDFILFRIKACVVLFLCNKFTSDEIVWYRNFFLFLIVIEGCSDMRKLISAVQYKRSRSILSTAVLNSFRSEKHVLSSNVLFCNSVNWLPISYSTMLPAF